MYLAFGGAVLAPLLDTIRWWPHITDLHYFFNWFDDYIAGMILLWGAWQVWKSHPNAQHRLIAVWGIATGNMIGSFVSQLHNLDWNDPAPVSSQWVAVVKGVAVLYCYVAMVLAIKKPAAEA